MRPAVAIAPLWLVATLAGGAETTVAIHEILEVTASPAALGAPETLDPYDPDQIRVDARLVGPDGAAALQPAFWLVPQERWEQLAYSSERKADVPWERFRAAGPGRWCLRVAPDHAGSWSWTWEVSRGGGKPAVVPGGTFTATARAGAGAGAGPVRVVGATLATAGAGNDAAPFIPIGINCAWPTELGSTIHEQWIDHLAAAGGNATRLWLVHYYGGTALEWTASGVNEGYAGVGRYSQEAGARVDRILAACAAREVKAMLCLYTFGDLNWDWEHNPYAKGGGGWLTEPREFFTDARARAATLKLLRYEVARWGASRALWAWELWNEVDTCEQFDDAAVTGWHREMAGAIARLDAHHHPITTDYRFTPPTSGCGAYALPELSFIQLHTYWPFVPEAFVGEIAHLRPFHDERGGAKPVVIGEYGLHVEPLSLEADPLGLHQHDGLWGGLFCGSAGGGMGWWWDGYVEPRGLWTHCRGIARFTRGETLAGLAPAPAASDAGDAAPALALAARDRVWAWVRNAREVRMRREGLGARIATYRVPRAGAARAVTVSAPLAGSWRVDLIDPFDGAWLASTVVDGTADGLTIPLPPYRHELALKATRAEHPAPRLGPPEPTPWHDELDATMGR